MAGLKQIMEIFMTINQPLSSEQRVRWYIQNRSDSPGGAIYGCKSRMQGVKFPYPASLTPQFWAVWIIYHISELPLYFANIMKYNGFQQDGRERPAPRRDIPWNWI